MKTASLIALTTALFLSATPIAFAQTGGAGAAVDLSLDANADGSVDADEAAAGVAAGADTDVDATLDTNGDGTVDEAEAEAAAGVEASAGASLDTDGDGVISEVEAVAGADLSVSEVCSSVDLPAMSSVSAADVAGATNAQVLSLTDCEDGVAGSLSADVLAALTANATIARVLQQETVGAGEILGLSVEAQTVLIYVGDDEDADSADQDETTTSDDAGTAPPPAQ